jgi:hypothetical protein
MCFPCEQAPRVGAGLGNSEPGLMVDHFVELPRVDLLSAGLAGPNGPRGTLFQRDI